MTNANTGHSGWARISVLLSGAEAERVPLEVGLEIAKSFDAQLNTLFAPPDPAELAPWLGEGFMGTVQVTAMESLKSVAEESEALARAQFAALDYTAKSFYSLKSPVWQDLACETRLSDLMVFGADSAKGQGLLAEAFTQVLMEERTGVFIARQALNLSGTAIVAWDGKEPSSRAARRAVPLLKKAGKVVIIGAPIGDRPVDLNRLANYYAAHGITAEVEVLPKGGDVVGALVDANVRHNAAFMVAGAFGHSRLREFAFGGTTRALLQNTTLNLYMAH
ncbi:universal stress protein [Asticcacaulis machinosus]|uniref:Universal stress protein n=1 Tax=Asticcacaulis machinosus TaxID=2984211 RepID=A0ABT5HFT7_9CAUL|nr:universal stress protein [Asticcacaulis machinosus]MDC7675110.1 universal stress protein [Asticcacaulis machinosus]